MAEKKSDKRIRFENERLYGIEDVFKGYTYYQRMLTERCMNIFLWDGLPDSLPAHELEYGLIWQGFAPFFKVPKYGLVTINNNNGAIYGFDEYYHATDLTYAQPKLGNGHRLIGKDCEVIYNSFVDIEDRVGLSELIKRYAILLADVDSSLDIVTVNRRATALNVAKTSQLAKSVNNVMQKIRHGTYDTINEESILDCFRTLPYDENTRLTLQELTTTKSFIMSEFWSAIGVKSSVTKRERVISDEIATENQMLLINVNDMLRERQDGVKKVNAMFGTNISVRLNPDFNPMTQYEDKNDEGVEVIEESEEETEEVVNNDT